MPYVGGDRPTGEAVLTYAIEAHGLAKTFGDKMAVSGVDLKVPAGSIYGFLGQNGAGKTTTLRMLLGILTPDAGYATILGDDYPLTIADRIGYLPEERGLYPAMTARETIAFMGALRGLPLKEGRARAEELLSRHGLESEINAKIRTFSKGMAQKVQLLGSFVHEPDLIILDEPFSGLDPVNQGALEAIITKERDRGATILFSTHIMSHAERLCDGLVIIAGGRTRFTGSVADARSVLPAQVVVKTRLPLDNAIGDLPGTFARDAAGRYRFPLPPEGLDATLKRLAAANVEIIELTTERPTLHDAFVAMVGDPEAKDFNARADGGAR
ncbi:ATP-binding cassette domain-containing protein [Pacificimonas sp. WHA3]|uniref:ATP-binding cassette domain-containing protein n=1 Tax=Pacificimonas pallii TaxID=2827236 RepID=A0ABS6SBL9_9SPHN|nr:ATP-binding cassette domain-containing protein [Pacificimonas pallii]MBV7255817.1 ATP-binding cassette domain-containing protein [Pacificimonas pallii]